MISARALASACHTNVLGGVSMALPRPDGIRSGARREKSGLGNASGGRGKPRGDSRRNRGHRHNRGGTRIREARENWAIKRRHLQRAKGQRGTSRDTPRPRRIYVSGRYIETRSMPTLSPTLTESSATTWRDRRGGVTSRSCHQGSMTHRVGESDGGSSGRWGRSSRGCGADCGTRSGSLSFRQ